MFRRLSFKLVGLSIALLGSMLACNLLAQQIGSQPSPAEQVEPTTPPIKVTQTKAAEPSATPQPSATTRTSDTPLPTMTPQPETYPASDESIRIGDFEMRVARIAYDNTFMGLVPAEMGSNDHILCVEFELLSGDQPAFEALELPVTDASGMSAEPAALMTGGKVNLLTSMTMSGEKSTYKPDPDYIGWAYVVPRGAEDLFLVFPEGERIDLYAQPAPASSAKTSAATSAPSSTPAVALEASPTPKALSSETPAPVTDTPITTQTETNTPLPTFTIAPKQGEQRIRVENNSGQDFSIDMVCTGGPCQQYTKNSYSYIFPSGLYYFYVYPGRYKITWTICGKTESFTHPLNGQWYINLKKCK